MKGAVPIPYIIALLLGIAVVAIIGYWFFVLGGQWGGETNLQTCNTRAYTYCASWAATGYSNDGEVPDGIIDVFENRYPECGQYLSQIGAYGFDGGVEEDIENCKSILGQSSSSSSSSDPTTP